MPDFIVSIVDFIYATGVPDQITQVDARGLVTNPWFLIPFIAFLGYQIYRQAINNLIFTGVAIGVWLFVGSNYAKGMIVNGVIQLNKILPIIGVGIVALGVLVYIIFMRQD